MNMIVEAIASLRPGVEFTVDLDDITQIMWQTEGVQPLTSDQISNEAARLEQAAAAAQQAATAAREAAIAQAKSLGFTDAMIAVMYPNLTMEA